MENILEAIGIISTVVLFYYMSCLICHLIKGKGILLPLIGYAVSSGCMCVLDLAAIIISINIEKSYIIYALFLVVFAIILLLSVLIIRLKLSAHKTMDVAMNFTLETDETDDDIESN